MTRARVALLSALMAVVLAWVGCGGDSEATPDAVDASDVVVDTAQPADTAEPADTAQPMDTVTPTAHVVILHTGNEGGWIAGVEPTGGFGGTIGGAALVAAAWKRLEPKERLVLSGGDSLLGAAVSSWFKGVPAVEVMNALGYDAVAPGNLEFNLGRAQLASWQEAADFVMLAANLDDELAEAPPVDGPWAVFVVDGVKVGVIGLAHPATSGLAPPQHCVGLTFGDPHATLEATLPAVRAAGADIVVVVAHLDGTDLLELAKAFEDEVAVVFGGHSPSWGVTPSGRGLVVHSGSRWVGYGRVAITFDRASGAITAREGTMVAVNDLVPALSPDKAIEALVESWLERVEGALGDTIGHLASPVAHQSWTQANWVTDAWRWSFPEADLAIQNIGGLRAALGPGTITRQHVVNVLQFDNMLLLVELTGAEVVAQLELGLASCGFNCKVPVSGLRYGIDSEGLDVVDEAGAPLEPTTVYTVVVNDFIFYGGAGFGFSTLGVTPEDTGLNYRDPAMAWTEAQGTTAASPLDALLDPVRRDVLPPPPR